MRVRDLLESGDYFSISISGDGGIELAVEKLAIREDLMSVFVESVCSETSEGDIFAVKQLILSFDPVNEVGGRYQPPKTGTSYDFYLWAPEALELVVKLGELVKTMDGWRDEVKHGMAKTRWTWQVMIEPHDDDEDLK